MSEYLNPVIAIIDPKNKDGRESVYEFINYFYHFNFQESDINNIVIVVFEPNKNIILGASILKQYENNMKTMHHINFICIDPKYYRKKIGSEIMNYIINKFKTAITLNILVSDIHLLKFYQNVCDKKKLNLKITETDKENKNISLVIHTYT